MAQTKPDSKQAQQGHGFITSDTPSSGFLPFAVRQDQVADLLSQHVAGIRGTSPDTVLVFYTGLESGYHYVFERELCLKHKDLTANDHKGKRALQLTGHEALVKAVATSEEALKVLARLLEKGRVEAVKAANKAAEGQHEKKRLVIDVSNLIADAKQSDRKDIELSQPEDIRLHTHLGGMVASWRDPLTISFRNMKEIKSLKNLQRRENLGLKRTLSSCAFIGGGGGSDVIQAAALAKLLQEANTTLNVPAVISIRTLYSKSTSAGEKRSVWDPADKTNPKRNLLDEKDGNLQIKEGYRGNARFVEDAIVEDFDNVRLVIDDKTEAERRCSRYERAIGENADSIFVVDTGGDVLGGMNPAQVTRKKTPDQDRRTQLATAEIARTKKLNAIVAIAALGVDAPPDAQAKLEASHAVYYRFTPHDKRRLCDWYSKWAFDGSATNLAKWPEHYGKTPFAMLASFKLKGGRSGYHALPLPRSVINDFNNPWACITWITPEMSCLVFASQKELLSVIASGQ